MTMGIMSLTNLCIYSSIMFTIITFKKKEHTKSIYEIHSYNTQQCLNRNFTRTTAHMKNALNLGSILQTSGT